MKLQKKELAYTYSNRAIAHILKSVAAVYIIKKEISFRIIAYQRAAEAIEHLNRELYDIWKEDKLADVEGIGPTIASHLDEYFKKGSSRHFDSVLAKVPATVFELIKIPSIGPKKAYKLAQNLHLSDTENVFGDLRKACIEGKIAEIPTFGKKSQEEILRSLGIYEKRVLLQDRMPFPYAFALAQDIIQYLQKHSYVKRIDILGSLRRMVATIGDIDIAVVSDNSHAKEIISYFTSYPKTISIDNEGEKKASIIVSAGIRIDLRVQEEKDYGSMLQYFTGSKSHNIKLREFAMKKGYSLSEYGVKEIQKSMDSITLTIDPERKSNGSKVKSQKYKSKVKIFNNEDGLYSFFGLQYVPPEIREGSDEIVLAQKNALPNLVEVQDVKGDLHTHSSYDLKTSHDLGANTYEEMEKKAQSLGYEYIGFSDHNPKITGLSKDDIVSILKKRKEHIDKTFSTEKVEHSQYFIGIESDILVDGSLAVPPEAHVYLDYIIASIHSAFHLSASDMTKRLLKALKHPKVRIIGHPTGRLLNKRQGINLEWEKIFEACKKNNIALEINSYPDRLDLPDTIVREAVRAGVFLIINTDAHAAEHMDGIFYGVSVARRGWCTKDDIINTKGYNEFKKWIFKNS